MIGLVEPRLVPRLPGARDRLRRRRRDHRRDPGRGRPSTCSSSRRARGSSRAASCRSRSSRWTGSTAPVASPSRSGCPSIAYTEGRCAGGGTEINSGLYRRPAPDTLARWRAQTDIADFTDDEFYAACDEIEIAAVGADRARPSHAGQRAAARRRRRPRLAARRDPALDELPATAATPRAAGAQSMTRTYLPRAFAAGARLLVEHRVDRLVRDGGRAFRAELTGADGRPVHHRLRHGRACAAERSRRRPCCSARAIRGLVGRALAVHPTVKLAARFAERGQRPRRRARAPGEGVRPRPVVRRLGQPARAWWRCRCTDHWPTDARRRHRRGATSRSTTRRSPARGAGACTALPGCATRWSPTASPAATARCSGRASAGWRC